jgi:hypothetical protein
VGLSRSFPGAVVGGVIAALVLASCSSAPAARAVVLTPGSVVPYHPGHNARSDVTTKGCTQVDGSWVLTGSVKNRATATTGYEIVVDFVTEPGSTVLSSSEVNVPSVAPGATVTWSAKGAQGKSHIGCIVRQAETT